MSEEYLLEEIINHTKSRHSLNFYRKAIRLLGEGCVETELGELKYQLKLGNVKRPDKYFTKLLQKQLNNVESEKKYQTEVKSLDTYQEQNQYDFFGHLKPVTVPADSEGTMKQMTYPFPKKSIPFPSFIGSEFFTLSSDKRKSDTVKYTTRTSDDGVIEVSLIRGKISPGDDERRILTVPHGRVFSALVKAWADKGRKHVEHKNGIFVCFVIVSARELADLLGWKNFGGSQLEWLKTAIEDLRNSPYYYQLEKLNVGLKGFGFHLIDGFKPVDNDSKKRPEAIFEIIFSTTVSWQLFNRRTVTRTEELMRIKNEIAFKLRLYLEPRLLSLDGKEYSIELRYLISQLQLPKVLWHNFKSSRKQKIEPAIQELNGQPTADGRIMELHIEKGLSDWLLVAWLKGTPKKVLSSDQTSKEGQIQPVDNFPKKAIISD